jgi:hypothetical protein
VIFDFRLAIDDLQAKKQSLPRNHVVGVCEGQSSPVIRSFSVLSGRPSDYANVQR